MPTGTAVDRTYEALRRKGDSKGKAARIAQSETGEALATGRPPKRAVKAANTVPPGTPRLGPGNGSKPAETMASWGWKGQFEPGGVHEDIGRQVAANPPKPRTGGFQAAGAGFSNDSEDAQMIGPSSGRTSRASSPGRRVLEELRQDKVRRQAPEKVINPLPDPIMAANEADPLVQQLIVRGHSPEDAARIAENWHKVVRTSRGTGPTATEQQAWNQRMLGMVAEHQAKKGVARQPGAAKPAQPSEKASEDAKMLEPSSTRVTPSPGGKVLQEMRQAQEARSHRKFRETRQILARATQRPGAAAGPRIENEGGLDTFGPVTNIEPDMLEESEAFAERARNRPRGQVTK